MAVKSSAQIVSLGQMQDCKLSAHPSDHGVSATMSVGMRAPMG